MKTIKIVDFEYSESVTALYISDKLYKYGDYYHDKIKDFIKGFLMGITYAGIDFELSNITIKEDNPWSAELVDLGGSPPEDFNDIYNKQPSLQ